MKDTTKVKVVIHKIDWVTKKGFVNRTWKGFRVAIGANPYGPRGGVSGKLVDGMFVTGQLSSRKRAEDIAAAILKGLES